MNIDFLSQRQDAKPKNRFQKHVLVTIFYLDFVLFFEVKTTFKPEKHVTNARSKSEEKSERKVGDR
jgi:hypothetical protein